MASPNHCYNSMRHTSSSNVVASSTNLEAMEWDIEDLDLEWSPSKTAKFTPECPTQLTPMIDQEFENEEAAYKFYNSYAKCCGFSVRRSQTRKSKKGDIYFRIFRCSKEGLRANKTIIAQRKRRERIITRCGCPALMTVRIAPGSTAWRVVKLIKEHSHNLESPSKSHCLRSHRSVPESELDIIEGLHKAGVGVCKSLQFMTEEMGGRDQVGYLEADLRYALRARRQSKYGGGAEALLKCFERKYKEAPGFTYDVQVDKENRLTACFWVDEESKRDYQVFNDVVCFDTTYRKNKYEMPFGPFVGVNHHKQSILLGAGLLFGETVTDFEWLFNTWLDAMGGIHPKAIVTDQDHAIMKAVAKVFPHTHHVLCAWHIRKKFTEKLAGTYQKYPDFKQVWNSFIASTRNAEEFEATWAKLMDVYGLTDNTWLQQLYALRHKWVPVFTRRIFLAGMTTTQRSESINAFFNHFSSPKSNLVEFVVAYDVAVSKRREDEKEADSKCSFGAPALVTRHAIEGQIAKMYTMAVFYEFQVEIEAAQYYTVMFVGTESRVATYIVHKIGDATYKRDVTWNEESQFATCSCRYFEWTGVLCRHILAMFRLRGVLSMPDAHVLRRWTLRPKEKMSIIPCVETTNVAASSFIRRHTALPKIHFILNELTADWDIYQIANQGIDKITAAIWAHKQKKLLAENSVEQQLAIAYESDHMTSQQSSVIGRSVAALNPVDSIASMLAGQPNSPYSDQGFTQQLSVRCSGSNDLAPSPANDPAPDPTNDPAPLLTNDPGRLLTNGHSSSPRIILDPHVVKAKGRTRKRLKSSLEKATERRGRLCRGCRKIVIGHDKRNCPSMLQPQEEPTDPKCEICRLKNFHLICLLIC